MDLLALAFEHMEEAFALHQMIFDASGKPVDYRFLLVNPAFERMTGMKAAEVQGRTFRQVLPGADPAWIEIYGRVAATGEVLQFQRVEKALGRCYSVKAFRLGKDLFACLFHDVTEERKRADHALRLSRLYLSMSQVNQAIARASDRMNLLKDACEELVRHGPFLSAAIYLAGEEGQLELRLAASASSPFARRCQDDTICAIAMEGLRRRAPVGWGNVPPEAPCVAYGLAPRVAACTAIPLWQSGKLIAILALRMDNAEQVSQDEMLLLKEIAGDIAFGLEKLATEALARQWQLELEETLRRYWALFAEAPVPYLITDPDGRVVVANREACALLGLNPDQLASINAPRLEQLASADSAGRLRKMLEDCVAGGFAEAEVALEPPGAGSLDVQVVARRIAAGLHGARQLHLALMDLTSLRAAERERIRLTQRLAQMQQMEAVGRLAAGVAHDFNNLLTVISGQAELMRLFGPAWEKWQEGIEKILLASARATEITRRLLLLGKPAAMPTETVDLARAVQEEAAFLKRVLREDIQLEVDVPDNPVPVLLAPGELGRILSNLALNAQAAMPQGGRVRISLQTVTLTGGGESGRRLPPGNYAQLRFVDTGPGIAPELIEQVFEPFYSTKPDGEGAGLGLSIVQSIVNRNGGQIWVERPVDAGACFVIDLPLCAAISETRPETAQPTPGWKALRPARLLLVDDRRDVLQVLADALELAGFQVSQANSAEEAFQLVKRAAEPPEVLVSDVVIPDLTGPELARRLQSLVPAMKVLFLSGYAPEEVRRRLPGSARLLQKPVCPEELVAAINSILQDCPQGLNKDQASPSDFPGPCA
jgi:PAS domain S-box-containing protein